MYLDLHGCNKIEAKIKLDNYLNNTIYHEVSIIHGYSSNILSNYVRKTYKHQRIKKRILTMNKGETIYLLK